MHEPNFSKTIAGRSREGETARTHYAGERQGFFAVKKTIRTLGDLNEAALEHAKNLATPMNSTQPAPLSQQQMDQLLNDPQFLEMGGQLYVCKLFHYIVNLTHAGNDTKSQSFQIDSDADFQLLFLMGTFTSSSLSIQVTEGSAGGLAWQSDAVNVNSYLGTAQNPFPAGMIPQLMPKKRSYKVTTIDSSGSANTVQVDFWGYKLYPAAMAAQLGAVPSSS